MHWGRTSGPSVTSGDTMILKKFINFAKQYAMGTLALRGGIVGINFAIMIGLAGFLGLDAFGTLAVTWGLALMVATVLSLGGPLMLLRHLTCLLYTSDAADE